MHEIECHVLHVVINVLNYNEYDVEGSSLKRRKNEMCILEKMKKHLFLRECKI